MFNVLSILCYGFAIVDVVLSWFGTDLTGVRWSPIVACGVGALFGWLAKRGAGEAGNDEATTE